MAYQKRKEERYKAFGGINNKVSQYLNGPMEFLSLENVDFQTPGSLTKRWGSTQLYGASYFQSQVYGLFNYNQINGSSQMIVAGSTTAFVSVPGLPGLTNLLGQIAQASLINFATYVNFATFGVSLGPVNSYFEGNANYDFTVFNNQVYACNGRDFWRWNGSTFYFFGIPLIPGPVLQGTAANTWNVVAGSSNVASGATGNCWFAIAYLNEQGVVGNASVVGFGNQGYQSLLGATSIFISASENLVRSMNPGYGISQLLVYMTPPQDSGTKFLNDYNAPLYYIGSLGLSAAPGNGATLVVSSTQIFNLGPTLAITNTIPYGRWYYSDDYSIPVTGQSYQLVGGTVTMFNGTIPVASLAANSLLANTAYGNMIPSMIENQGAKLFYAGSSYFLSTVFWSDEFVPERIQPEANLEIRTDDGEIITAIKSYNGNLMIFKTSTFHSLNTAAEDFENWQLTQISSEYGCLGNRAVTEYENLLVFLDRKGVIQYNGANISILSIKTDPIFARMNVPACKDHAKLTYDKQRNQILCDIPVDGSTFANLTAVYDIVAQAWTTYKGYAPASTARTQIPGKDSIVYGGYTGVVSYFGSSFTTDNGVGFTCVAKSGFLTDLGNSTQKVFRRLWLDTTPVGASSAVDVHIYQDYGASIIVSTQMYQNPFQSRIDFGVSAKSISLEFVMGSTYTLAMHGFAIAYRFQRNV